MNYLAHAYLSFGNKELLIGNMIADHVKGRSALGAFPEEIQKGILLHREIDAFTDAHPAVIRTKVLFRTDYRLYAGAILDSLFDHYLANDPQHFESEAALKDFAEKTYQMITGYEAVLPPAFAQYFPHMRKHDWLGNYRNLQGIRRSLKGVEQRAKYMPDSQKAYETFIGYYYQINQAYFELMDDLVKYVKSETGR
jgi:acyl carrier protein phosphodiesterase